MNKITANLFHTYLISGALERETLFHTDMLALKLILCALRARLSPEVLPLEGSHGNGENRNYGTLKTISLRGRQNSRQHMRDQLAGLDGHLGSPRQNARPSTIGRLWALGGKTMTTTRALQDILVSQFSSVYQKRFTDTTFKICYRFEASDDKTNINKYMFLYQ